MTDNLRTESKIRPALPGDAPALGQLGALLVVVDPAYRGQGIGGMLLETAIEMLKARGVPRVVLSTAERNETARRLFARAGFRRTMIEMTRELA